MARVVPPVSSTRPNPALVRPGSSPSTRMPEGYGRLVTASRNPAVPSPQVEQLTDDLGCVAARIHRAAVTVRPAHGHLDHRDPGLLGTSDQLDVEAPPLGVELGEDGSQRFARKRLEAALRVAD